MYTEKDEFLLAFKFTAKAKMLVGSAWVLWFLYDEESVHYIEMYYIEEYKIGRTPFCIQVFPIAKFARI